MKIGIITPSLEKQAPIMIAAAIANNLANQNHDVTIFYFSGKQEVSLNKNINIVRIKFLEPIEFNNFDIIHSHLFRPDLYVFLHTFLRKRKCKFITTLHNYVYPELTNYYNPIISFFFGRIWNLSWLKFNCLVTLTEHSKKYYEKISYNKRIETIHNGIDIKEDGNIIEDDVLNIHKTLKSKTPLIIGTYCNLIKRKNISLLIDYVHNNNAGLIVFGDGPEKENLLKKVNELDLSERVYFLGYRENAYRYNKLFDIYAIPSIDEGFGLALIEAALLKKKIVCSDIPVFKEIFNDKCVSFFNPNSVKSLSEAINTILNKSGCEDLAFDIAKNKFSEKIMTDNYISLYNRILKGKNA
ncbi:glycosyltransferase family 4 protein [Providencia stuartii]|uniref:Glycosyltransferase n=1 Tax=Providencia stuartii TaxID=588 RepID=H9XTP7_PROST|nr:glycosyltransferase family 4 protein [Providencia stuartii]AFH02793.1 glycosyltransferase [Providencia stuartii]MCX3070486.1 glycosyltransferase family 4 protein [Providencia stuartii]